ncbi:(d)CMP kinase [Desulfopila inferna]|mgnify:CR=1 FL=1|uniref:(d)CMP kinase n=1 Tax=Desulfopila inferna TaxID=468528 RepID=UPI0019642F1F|nr:(d)CMP kinase [Desulfopila inferna]MBM9603933.1 (d)CMP kinase [Desulfopila inferna]
MLPHQQIITIDGPSGVGKSSVSRRVASKLGYTYLDTGAMYRGVGLFFYRSGIEVDDEAKIAPRLKEIDILLIPPTSTNGDVGVILNGEDVSAQIRTPEMAMIASKISALPCVRSFLTDIQRKLAQSGKIVAEGRDMGTVVFPQAAHKFFLDADARERCSRRVIQLREKGIEVDGEEMLEMIRERDRNDSRRAVAPLKKADDAQLINTTVLTFEQVCEEILSAVARKAGSTVHPAEPK